MKKAQEGVRRVVNKKSKIDVHGINKMDYLNVSLKKLSDYIHQFLSCYLRKH